MTQSDLTLFIILWLVTALWAVTRILRRSIDPRSMIIRIFIVVFIPIVGSLFYGLFFYRRRFPKLNRRRKTPKSNPAGSDELLSSMASRLTGFPETEGNHVDLLLDASQALDAICDAIATAKYYVFVEYYIISTDKVTRRITNEMLKAKDRGVRVRVMYDVIGSRTFRGESNFFLRLKGKGLRIIGFLPLRSFFRMFNLSSRNHRKLLVVDGRIAFSGGTNIGVEYFGRWHKGQQHDYTFRFQGPVCKHLETVFARDWSFVAKEEEELNEDDAPITYPIPESNRSLPGGHNISIQVLPSGPDTRVPVFYSVMMEHLYQAKSSVCCITPYFIPPDGFKLALMNAAARGVKVRLIIPSKIDWNPVLLASRSYWEDFLYAGIEIYEFAPVLLHAKLTIFDEKWVLLGSSNLDVRSFTLNYELDFMLHSENHVRSIQDLFETEIKKSKRIDIHRFHCRPMSQKMLENTCRLLSPML